MTRAVIGFAGLTHLGLVSASAVASKGFRTVCFDRDRALVERIIGGVLPVLEPDLDRLIAANRPHQSFTADPAGLSACDVVYLSLDIPTDDAGHGDTGDLNALVDDVARVLRPDAVLVVLSQVAPGFTRAIRAVSADRLYCQVETLIFGRAVERATKPERYIVGCADPERPLPPRLAEVLAAFACPILPMHYESAELAKISINVCLAASISVANTLSELCEAIGADWAEIAPALKLDRRIGPAAYLAPGLGIAGGNIERDLATVRRLADRQGTDARVVDAFIDNSRYRRDWPLRVIQERVVSRRGDPRIGVLGITYKENTRSLKNSPAVALLTQLRGVALCAFDPVVTAESGWSPSLTAAPDAMSVFKGVDAVAVMTPWPVFKTIDLSAARALMRGRLLVDPFALFDRSASAAAGFDHIVLGTPPLRRGS